MFRRLILFIVLIPLIELVLLSQMLKRTGFLITILVVLFTGVVGVTLTRRQGMQAWRAVHQQMSAGQSPSREILNAVMILLAGVFLITPGLLTDCVGFTLLVPHVRLRLGRWLTRWFMQRTAATFQMSGWTGTSFDETTDTDRPPAGGLDDDALDDDAVPTVRVVEPETRPTRIDEQ
ncbi:MAG: FxsA family protein [Fuerstiella sp.]